MEKTKAFDIYINLEPHLTKKLADNVTYVAGVNPELSFKEILIEGLKKLIKDIEE